LKQQPDQPTSVSDHCGIPGHSIDNLEIIPLELMNSNIDSIGKAKEGHLILKVNTLEL